MSGVENVSQILILKIFLASRWRFWQVFHVPRLGLLTKDGKMSNIKTSGANYYQVQDNCTNTRTDILSNLGDWQFMVCFF